MKKIKEEIEVLTKYKIQYDDISLARAAAVKYVTDTLPYHGVKTTKFGDVVAERGESKLATELTKK